MTPIRGGGRDGGPGDRKKSGRPGNAPVEEGWTSVPSKTSQRGYDKIDANKISNLANRSDRRVSEKFNEF
jgi:hypothetical protein